MRSQMKTKPAAATDHSKLSGAAIMRTVGYIFSSGNRGERRIIWQVVTRVPKTKANWVNELGQHIQQVMNKNAQHLPARNSTDLMFCQQNGCTRRCSRTSPRTLPRTPNAPSAQVCDPPPVVPRRASREMQGAYNKNTGVNGSAAKYRYRLSHNMQRNKLMGPTRIGV